MGVKTHFLLNFNGSHYTDLVAYKILCDYISNEVKRGRMTQPELKGGWQKRLVLLYKTIVKQNLVSLKLSVMKTRYPHRDPSFASISPRAKRKNPPSSRKGRRATEAVLNPPRTPGPPRPATQIHLVRLPLRRPVR